MTICLGIGLGTAVLDPQSLYMLFPSYFVLQDPISLVLDLLDLPSKSHDFNFFFFMISISLYFSLWLVIFVPLYLPAHTNSSLISTFSLKLFTFFPFSIPPPPKHVFWFQDVFIGVFLLFCCQSCHLSPPLALQKPVLDIPYVSLLGATGVWGMLFPFFACSLRLSGCRTDGCRGGLCKSRQVGPW